MAAAAWDARGSNGAIAQLLSRVSGEKAPQVWEPQSEWLQPRGMAAKSQFVGPSPIPQKLKILQIWSKHSQ